MPGDHGLPGFRTFGGGVMVTRPTILTLTPGDMDDIERAARDASRAVAHLHADVDRRTQRCGHRVTTACTDQRCTIVPLPCA